MQNLTILENPFLNHENFPSVRCVANNLEMSDRSEFIELM